MGGEEILSMLKTSPGNSLINSLPKDFSKIITSSAREYEEESAKTLGLNPGFLRGVFVTESYLLDVDSNRLDEIKFELESGARRAELREMQDVAKKLSKRKSLVQNLVRKVMELDLRIAIGSFCVEKGLSPGNIQGDIGFGIKGGKNLFLKGEVKPVDYVVGNCNLFPDRAEKAILLTGANSGGKTSLLELIVQSVLLLQMGLWIPAIQARGCLFEEIFYFAKGQRTDAGAFESLLKTFEALAKPSKRRRLILADEIEAITEPGAAGKILAALLDWFKKDHNTVIVIVTHLGKEIENAAGEGVRIDGIEATGLDEDLNLIVERKPIFGKIAKSTPELIVQRLSKRSKEKDFYRVILDRFKER